MIYDSAIDPALWPRALEGMCGLIDAFFGSLTVFDRSLESVRFLSRWGGDPYWIDLLDRKYANMMPFLPILDRFELGQPFNMMTAAGYLGDPEMWNGPFVTEWAGPAGLRDTAAAVVLRTDRRVVSINLATGFHRGEVTEAELFMVGLLIPHVRRAVSISDLIDRKSLAADTFERMLNTLRVSVLAVDTRFRVSHANQAARVMLEGGGPLAILGDKVVARGSTTATITLHKAISRAGHDESRLTGSGTGVPLRFADGRPAIGHVLPMHHGEVRQRIGHGAAATIFVATPIDSPQAPIEALAGLYGLTDAEKRVLMQIAGGKNRSQTAASLSIADSTAKTHLDRIFSKTGTSTQAELARLLSSLSLPVTPA